MNAEPEKRRLTLKKRDKLVLKKQFDDVRQRGEKQISPGLVLAVAPFEQLECGVICSRKFSHLAVERNRARRLLWESFRLLKPEILPCRMVLIPRQRIKGYSRQQVTLELAKALCRAGVMNPDELQSLPEC